MCCMCTQRSVRERIEKEKKSILRGWTMETFSICSPTIHFRLLNDKSSNFPCICFCFILDFYLNMLILLKSRPRDHVKSFSSEIYDLSSGLWTAFASGSFCFSIVLQMETKHVCTIKWTRSEPAFPLDTASPSM